MTPSRTVLALAIAACAETPTPKSETSAAAIPAVEWDEAATAALDAYGRATHEKWLTGNVDAAQDGVAGDTALLYDVDPGGSPVRIVGPEAIRRYAGTIGAFIQKLGVQGSVERQTCRATTEAGVCTTEFAIQIPLPDEQSLTLRQRGTCIAAQSDEEWRWTHCHLSPAEWPDPAAVKLSSTHGNKEGLKWEKTPGGFEMATVWRNPLTGHYAAFARFKVEWGDSERHFHDATALAAVLEGQMRHWSEGGTMYEVGPGGFALIGGGRENAHTSEFDEGTVAFGLFDKPMNRISTAEAAAAAAMQPPPGEAPWDDGVTSELEAFSRGEMKKWETMDVDAIASTQADVGLPTYSLGADGKPSSVASAAELLELARKMAASGMSGTVDIKDIICRGTRDFGWCALDYDLSTMGPDEKPMTMSFRGTGIAARQASGWKSIHWHGSLAKFPGPPPPSMQAVKPEDMKWEDLAGAPGAQMATVWKDPASGGTAAFLKINRRWKGMPAHFHSHNLHYVVLKGSYSHVDNDGTKRVTKQGGWGFEAARNVHRTEGQKGTLVFIVTDGPRDSVKVDAQGNPIESKAKN